LPTEIRAAVPAVKAPGVYARTRAEVKNRADVGDPRLLLDESITAEERQAINATIPEVQRMRELAERMKRGEKVKVSGKYARDYPELTALVGQSGRGYPDLQITSDDLVTLVYDYPAKPGELG
jgi:hypothetical protein